MTNYASDVDGAKALVEKYETLRKEIGKVIVGQHDIIHNTILSIFCQGHVLLVGVPGLAKTLLVNTIGKALGLSFSRIQFTPDLMPSDIVGTEILDESRQFKFIKGPVFANIVLADEINRTPPKTQAALLEAMQEIHLLPRPCAARRRAWLGQDPISQHHRQSLGLELQPYPVYPRPDAFRHRGYRDSR